MTSSEHYPVVIVGGGPVGMGLAIDLGKRGVRCLVLERHETPQRIPKGQNLTQRTMEHFAFWGVEGEIRAARQMPPGYPNSGVTAYGDLMRDWSYPWWRRSAVAEYYSRSNERIPQYETERVLRARSDELASVDVWYGWSGEGIVAGHLVETVNEGTGERATISGDFIVGCDGSSSTIREAVGIPRRLSDHDRRMVLLVFRSPELHQIVERFGEVAFFNIMDPALDGYWKFLGRVDGAGHFFFHAPIPPAAEVGDGHFADLLFEAVGSQFDLDLDYSGLWDLRFAIARQYRRGDVFVAGDAAHSHPPYGGYGINTGFEDARNLGWKLAAKIQGWGSEALLDSYDAERRPVFESTASDFIEKMIEGGREFLARHDPGRDRADFETAWEQRKKSAGSGVGDFEPHYEGSPVVIGGGGGPPGAVGTHVATARPGHHLPPGAGVFDRLGPNFTLVAAAGSTDGFVAAAADLDVPLQLVDGASSGYGSALVLVRPDHHVAWAGDEAGVVAARAVLSRVTGR